VTNEQIYIPFVHVRLSILVWAVILTGLVLVYLPRYGITARNYSDFLIFSAVLMLIVVGRLPLQHSFIMANSEGLIMKPALLSTFSLSWDQVSRVEVNGSLLVIVSTEQKRIRIPFNRIVLLDPEFAKKRLLDIIRTHDTIDVAA
jgi:hypothetical protein